MGLIEKVLFVVCFSSMCAMPLSARNYYSDPIHGDAKNSGTRTKPWPALDTIIAESLFSKLRAGDVLYLRNGYHGEIEFGGDNSSPITIKNDEGAVPQLASLTISSARGWIVQGLSISPSYGAKRSLVSIVSIGDKGESSDILLKDCHVFGALNTNGWKAKDWLSVPKGIWLGRRATRLHVKNCFVQNVRFGITITSADSSCLGNVVSDFSGDGIQITRDNTDVAYNIVKNSYLTESDGDKNHDDAIQCFRLNNEPGTMYNVKVHHNLIYMRENPNQKFPSNFQGIGFFSGPSVNFELSNNVVATQHFHGISLYNAKSSKVIDNVVYNPWKGKMNPWVMLGEKPLNNGLTRGNEVRGNFAYKVNISIDKQRIASSNGTINSTMFYDRALELLQEIDGNFGEIHQLARQPRFNKELLSGDGSF